MSPEGGIEEGAFLQLLWWTEEGVEVVVISEVVMLVILAMRVGVGGMIGEEEDMGGRGREGMSEGRGEMCGGLWIALPGRRLEGGRGEKEEGWRGGMWRVGCIV